MIGSRWATASTRVTGRSAVTVIEVGRPGSTVSAGVQASDTASDPHSHTDSRAAPNTAHPAQSISAAAEVAGLGRQRGEHLLVRRVEAGDALVLKGQPDVVHVDTYGGQPAHHLGCLLHPGVDGAAQR